MPGKHNAGGCDCCAGGDITCTHCAGAAPAELTVRVGGITNDYCTDCDAFNGDFAINIVGAPGCYWVDVFALSLCGGATQVPAIYRVTLTFTGGHYYIGALVSRWTGFATDPFNVALFELDLGTDKPNCNSLAGVIPLVSSVGELCDFSAATFEIL